MDPLAGFYFSLCVGLYGHSAFLTAPVNNLVIEAEIILAMAIIVEIRPKPYNTSSYGVADYLWKLNHETGAIITYLVTAWYEN